MRYLIAAGAIFWGGATAAACAFFVGRGKLINEWRDYCAEYAKRQQFQQFQQFDVEPRYVDAEIARIEAELEQQR